jgi:AbrB family looped-hinge helix DNA binding protein
MRVTEKGQVTIPKEIREQLGIVAGSEVDFIADSTGARLIVLADHRKREPADFEAWLNSVSGTLDTGGMTTDEYMEWLRGPRDDLDPR